MSQREITGIRRSVDRYGEVKIEGGQIDSLVYPLFALPRLVSAEYHSLCLSEHNLQCPGPVLMERCLIYEVTQGS
jgi:hypothetical protein